MCILEILNSLTNKEKEDSEDKLKKEFIKNGEQEEFNFEEEELEEDDYYYEDEK